MVVNVASATYRENETPVVERQVMLKIYEWWKTAARPCWPHWVEIQAQAYDAFDAWCRENGPDGNGDTMELIERYANDGGFDSHTVCHVK